MEEEKKMEKTMTKKKKAYVAPTMQFEEFVPNEYVSACWGVACNCNASNSWEKQHNTVVWRSDGSNGHRDSNCGNSGNQVIQTNSNGVPQKMTEIGTDGLGKLVCTRYTDNNYNTEASFAGVSIGNTIYWTTSAGNKIWHHQGTVFASNPTKPNMS